VRQWERLEWTGRTPLGTDQNYYQPVLGRVPVTAPHAPQGAPALWANGFSFADWQAGLLGGTHCCNLCELEGGGSGGGQFTFDLLPQPPITYSVIAWIDGIPNCTGFFTATWGPSATPSGPGWASGLNPTATDVGTLAATLYVTGNYYGPGVMASVLYNATGGVITSTVFTYEQTSNPFFGVYSMELGATPLWTDIELILAPFPVMVMSQGGEGGGQFYWRDQWPMDVGGAGGGAFAWPPVNDMVMGIGGEGGGNWPITLTTGFPMDVGGAGGGQWFFFPNFSMLGGPKAGGPTTITTKPVVISGTGGGSGGEFGVNPTPTVNTAGGGGGGGVATITP